MPKIHKNKTPVPGRILVQGFSWMEASAKFVSFFGYAIFKELKAFLPFHKVRAEYEFKGLDNAMDYLYEYNTQQNWDSTRECTLIELDVEGCSLKIIRGFNLGAKVHIDPVIVGLQITDSKT